MAKKFIAGVANAYFYSSSDALLFQSKTLIKDGIQISTDKAEIRGGQGNKLQMVYFHTSSMSGDLEDCQFNLDFIASNIGSAIVTGAPVWVEEDVTLTTGGAGTVTLGTPIETASGNIYGWATKDDGTTERVTFTSTSFTVSGAASGDVVTIRYYVQDAAARKVTVNSNIIPSIGRLVLDAQLFSGDTTNVAGSSLIGKVQIEVDRAQLAGAQNIDLTSSGVATTPLQFNALDYNGRYATITEIVDDANWYDTVSMIALADPTVTVTTAAPTQTLEVWAIPAVGNAFKPPVADLTFTSAASGTATVSSSGVVTKVANGNTTVSVKITAKTTVEAIATVVVS